MKFTGSTLRVPTLAAVFTAAAMASAAAQPKGTAGGQEQPAPIDVRTMTAMFLSANPGLRTDPAFARDWTVTTKCPAWTKLQNDEFKSAPFLKAGANDLAADRDAPPPVFELRLDRYLGRYDAAKREFDLRAVGPDDVLPLRIEGFQGEGQVSAFRPGCEPTGGRYPVEFAVTFDNSAMANGLPMPPDAAAAFAQARTSQGGSRDNHVVVDLKLRLNLGASHPVPPASLVKGVVVPVSAHIEDVTIEDGTPQRRPLYRLDDGKRQAGEIAVAQAKEQARVEASVKPLDGAALQAQFDMERSGAKVGPQPFRIGMPTSWSKRAAPADGWAFSLRPSDAFSMGSGISLRFDNADEVSAAAPSPEMRQAFDKFQVGQVSLVYVPVGASDDALKGGRFVMGHVLSIETQDFVGGARRVSSVPLSSNPAPWKMEADTRTSDSFDLLGIKTGMAPGEVSSIAASELGQKLAFDETKGEVRSSAVDCDFEVRRGQSPPPLGRRCLAATFLRNGDAGAWALVRVRLTQSIGADRQKATFDALIAKYGKPDLVQPFDGPLSLTDLEGTDAPRMVAVGWGARFVNVRPEPDGIPFPLHPLEATTKTVGDETFVGLTVTDWAAMNAAKEAKAAAAKRASEAVVPKF